MAKVRDYVGQRFGPFEITGYMASGQEADVFACTDERNGLSYVLRLDSADAAVWSGAPLLPPRNASIERPNAHNSRLASGAYWSSFAVDRRRRGDGLKVRVTDVYAVLDVRYLVAVAPSVRVSGSVDVDAVVRAVPSASSSLIWRELCQAIAAHAEPPMVVEEETLVTWLEWLAGDELARSAAPWLFMSDTPADLTARLETVLTTDAGKPPLEENILLRLAVAFARDIITLEQLERTMRCRHFRANVSADEVHQLLAAANVVTSLVGFDSAAMYHAFVRMLTEAPYDEYETPDEFEVREDDVDVDRFELFLQSPAGSGQQPVVLVTTEDGYHLSVAAVGLPVTA
jgi:hypothetical protein